MMGKGINVSSSSIDLLELFVRSPGELLYFFTVIALCLASLFMSLGQRARRPNDYIAQRYVVSLLGVLTAWILLLVGGLFVVNSDRDSVTILPPLERFAIVITILLIGWVFLIADQKKIGKFPNILLLCLIVGALISYGISAKDWVDTAGEVDFNLSTVGTLWSFAAAVLSAAGIVAVIARFRLIIDAPLKLVFFVILFIGNFGALIQIGQGSIIGDYAGPIRLAMVTALLITPFVIFRIIVSGLEREILQKTAESEHSESPTILETKQEITSHQTPPSPIDRESVQLLRVLGLMLEDATADSVPERVVTATLDVLKADVAALLRMKDANYIDVDFAYDKIMKRTIGGIAINLDNQPTLVNAIERNTQHSLTVGHNEEELRDLFTRLDIEQIGPACIQPIFREKELVAILIVASPHTERELLQTEEELLKGISVIASGLLALSYSAADARMTAEEHAIQAMVQGALSDQGNLATTESIDNLPLAREQINQLSKQVMQLKIELDDERTKIANILGESAEGLSISQSLLALTEEQKTLRREREELSRRLLESEAALGSAINPNDQGRVNDLVEALQQEKIALSEERERVQRQLDDLRANDKLFLSEDVQVLLDNMIREKAQLEKERDQFSVQLIDIGDQLREIGIDEGSDGLAQLITTLNEQRTMLQAQIATVSQERDQLLEERHQIAEQIKQEEERTLRIQSLEQQLENIAGDREAAVKNLNKLRHERDELQEKLDAIKEHRTRLLAQSSSYEMELQEAHEEQANLQQQIQELANTKSDLQNEQDRLYADKKALESERDQLLARVEGDRDRLTEIGASGIGSLTAMIDDLTQQRNDLEHELNQTRTTLASVENQFEALQVRVGQELDGVQARYSPNAPDLLLGLVQELRTPMTSVTGYVDLLLGESAGILGEMQRKFLQRVATNVSRLASMLDDLVHVTELDTGSFSLEPRPVNLTNLIEDAITGASIQFREKELVVNLNLDDTLPEINADHDAISQIIGQLLTNAYLVSPPGSEIFVSAQRQNVVLSRQANDDEYMAECLTISIEDRGGGISAEDEQRVFIRKYKAENPLIEGLGDTGVGLSIAKALTEAHGGQLLLESKENIGTVFTVALPVDTVSEPEGLNNGA
jgi:signal transduction histidine kinase